MPVLGAEVLRCDLDKRLVAVAISRAGVLSVVCCSVCGVFRVDRRGGSGCGVLLFLPVEFFASSGAAPIVKPKFAFLISRVLPFVSDR